MGAMTVWIRSYVDLDVIFCAVACENHGFAPPPMQIDVQREFLLLLDFGKAFDGWALTDAALGGEESIITDFHF
jgi:hypothetical protein